MNTTNSIHRSSGEGLFWLFLFAVATLMTLKYFPGLEGPQPYGGGVFQSIYPNAFPNDPYMGPERSILEKPYQLSLWYILPKISGEIWLDDRFNVFVYLGLVLITLVGIDKIVRLAGINDYLSRMIVQLVFMHDHQILNNEVYFAHQPDFNHASFAIPVFAWLVYATFAHKKLWIIAALCVLLTGLSIKNAPYTIAFCLIVYAVNGNRTERAIIYGVFAAALAAFVVSVIYILPVPEVERVPLFDMNYTLVERWHANPIYPFPDTITNIFQNIVFVLLCLVTLFIHGSETTVFRSIKIFVSLGLILWLIAVLYYSFAPDAIKLPHFLPFTPVRNLRFPQTVAYIGLLVYFLHLIIKTDKTKKIIGGFLGIGLLFILGPGKIPQWIALFLGSVGAAMMWHFFLENKRAGPISTAISLSTTGLALLLRHKKLLILTHALTLSIIIAFAFSIAPRMSAWKTLVAHGVMGDNPTAEWIGIAEYIRKNTPRDAVVLPIQPRPNDPDHLYALRYIAARSGRTTPIINEYSDIFSLKGQNREYAQKERLQSIALAFETGAFQEAERLIQNVVPAPTHLTMPIWAWEAGDKSGFPFKELTRIRGYVITQRTAEQ